MKILLNVSVLRGPLTGIGHYTFALAKALCRQREIEPFFFDGLSAVKDVTPTDNNKNSRVNGLIKRWVPWAYQLRRHLMQHRFNTACRIHKPDIYHEPSLWPLNSDIPSVVTLHDLTHVHYPETQPSDRLSEIERRCAKGLDNAGSVLVDSEFIAREVIEHFGVSREKLVVAPLGVSSHFRPRSKEEVAPFLEKQGLCYGRYILSIGTLEPRKNLSFTLKAHRLLPDRLRKKYPLILVGAAGWNQSQFSADLAAGLSEGSVRMMGYMDDQRLAMMTNGGRMLVYPSLYEGFGLPVIEAMASGLPVITSKRASLPEVAGAAAVYIDLDDLSAYTRQMVRLIEDEKRWKMCKENGFKQASKFTWQRCAEKTLSAYRLALRRFYV